MKFRSYFILIPKCMFQVVCIGCIVLNGNKPICIKCFCKNYINSLTFSSNEFFVKFILHIPDGC